MRSDRRPRVGFIGIHAGRRRDRPISQNEIVANRLERDGWTIRMASDVRPPMWRTAHQLLAILSWWRRVDVIVVAVFSGRSFLMAELAQAAAWLIGVPTVLVLHGGNLPVFAATRRRRVRRLLDQGAMVVAPSTFLAEAFAEDADVVLIPNTFEVEPVHRLRSPARPALLWMRTFHELYDPVLAVEVLERVRAVHPGATMTMAGADRGMLDIVRDEVARRGLEDAVRLPGFLDGADKAAAFRDHDLFLNTNRIDNAPVTVLEACAHGLVVVATRVGGVPHLLEQGREAIFVEPGDAPAMAAAALDVLADPALAARLSSGAGARSESSLWPAVRARWESVFDQAIVRHHSSPRHRRPATRSRSDRGEGSAGDAA